MSDGSSADTNTSITESAALSWIAYDNHAKGYYRDETGTVKWVVLCDVRTYHKNTANQRSISWVGTYDPLVERIQYTFNYMDNGDFNLAYDGYFGSITRSVVTEYQYHRNDVHNESLSVDGVVGQNTYYSMSKCVE